jgi:hypothetical protein
MWRIGRAPNSISIYSYIQQNATSHSLFISGNCSICFMWYFHPSSGAHTTLSTESGICHTVTAICRYRGRVGTSLSVLWVAHATHSTLKPVPYTYLGLLNRNLKGNINVLGSSLSWTTKLFWNPGFHTYHKTRPIDYVDLKIFDKFPCAQRNCVSLQLTTKSHGEAAVTTKWNAVYSGEGYCLTGFRLYQGI